MATSASRPVLPFGTLAQIAMSLRKDSRAAVVATGELPALNKALYIKDQIDTEIETWLSSPGKGLMLLTGSAGNGKSAAIALADARSKAEGIPLKCRPDASHADREDETYREALRRFLDLWLAEGEPVKFLLGINLGKALDFLSSADDLAKYSDVARALNLYYRLGLSVGSGQPAADVRILDLAQRIRPSITDHGVDLPLVRSLLERFDPETANSVVSEAVRVQSERGMGTQDPLQVNLHTLNNPHFREHFVQALVSCTVRHDVHLTPRNILDLLSGLILPPRLEAGIGPDGMWTAEFARHFAGPENWKERLEATLLHYLFPPAAVLSGSDQTLFRAVQHEDPTFLRTEKSDRDLLEWGSNPGALSREVPEWLVDYVGWTPDLPLENDHLRHMLQAARWLSVGETNPRVTRIERFLRLCQGSSQSSDNEVRMLQTGLRQCLTKSYYRVVSERDLPDQISVRVHRTSIPVSLRTQLDSFDVSLGGARNEPGRPHSFAALLNLSGGRVDRIDIDWVTYDLISDVHGGLHPGSTNHASSLALDRLLLRLQEASRMDRQLQCGLADSDQDLILTKRGAGRLIHAEAR
jgi:hypothetical protein